ncbi:MAG: hypothetical protein BroJett024_41570 [Alphaproteobacteria bacterium]|nr:MAG: hypothetical protein BroJett024_41570 [Alphaproteobacteria bacterium]
MSTVALADQIACVRRELAMRQRVYPRWVSAGKMTQADSDREITTMIAVLATLQEVQRQREPGLFA